MNLRANSITRYVNLSPVSVYRDLYEVKYQADVGPSLAMQADIAAHEPTGHDLLKKYLMDRWVQRENKTRNSPRAAACYYFWEMFIIYVDS